jgi:hypothetical protein
MHRAPSRTGRLAALALACGVAGCGAGEVDLRILFDGAVDVAAVVDLRLSVSGDETFETVAPIGQRIRDEREARIVYHAGIDEGRLVFLAEARDVAQTVRARGEARDVPVSRHGATSAVIHLAPNGDVPPDLGVAASDLATEPDLASSADDGATATGCAAATVLLCDDFESGEIDPARWTALSTPSLTTTIDATRSRSGTRALHLHGEPTSDMGATFLTAGVREDAVVPSRLFVRAWVYPSATLPPIELAALFRASQRAAPFDVAELSRHESTSLAVGDTHTPPIFATSATGLPANRWSCLEWEVRNDATGREVRVWLGGATRLRPDPRRARAHAAARRAGIRPLVRRHRGERRAHRLFAVTQIASGLTMDSPRPTGGACRRSRTTRPRSASSFRRCTCACTGAAAIRSG